MYKLGEIIKQEIKKASANKKAEEYRQQYEEPNIVDQILNGSYSRQWGTEV